MVGVSFIMVTISLKLVKVGILDLTGEVMGDSGCSFGDDSHGFLISRWNTNWGSNSWRWSLFRNTIRKLYLFRMDSAIDECFG